MKYSPGFRVSIIRKTQDGSGRSTSQLAPKTGISYTTILNWIEKYRTGKLSLDDADGMTPHQRNPGEKLALLLENKILPEEQKGEWLRQHRLPYSLSTLL
ncbi:transposase [Oceanispirochaeta sp.]|jgi:transposase-like protein|uniref:transposase n=1 Tax=Oceanispirochaeta sp. TaxID=2035350 RepID=UPI00262D9F50|nr:transposase [Oceanispirochaeta sp.]MDA3956963.1 transposase [Oceanispirochaeta sp.]